MPTSTIVPPIAPVARHGATARRSSARRNPEATEPIIGIGAGGHGRCVIDAIRSLPGRFSIAALFDSDVTLAGTERGGVRIVGPFPAILELDLLEDVTTAFVGVGGIGDLGPRRRVFRTLIDAGFDVPAIVHRSAVISPFATLATGAQVLAGAVVNADAFVGENAIVNARAVVGHDARIGAHTHVASGAVIGGGAIIGSSAHIGSGATVLEGRTVGEGAVVGSGAVVNRDVLPETTVVGVPARPIAHVRPIRIARARRSVPTPGQERTPPASTPKRLAG